MPTTGNSSWGVSGSFTGRREALQGQTPSPPRLQLSPSPAGSGGHGQGLAAVPWGGTWPQGGLRGFTGISHQDCGSAELLPRCCGGDIAVLPAPSSLRGLLRTQSGF